LSLSLRLCPLTAVATTVGALGLATTVALLLAAGCQMAMSCRPALTTGRVLAVIVPSRAPTSQTSWLRRNGCWAKLPAKRGRSASRKRMKLLSG